MIDPGSTIGIFGSGQLGRMFAIEARKMGYRVACFSPEYDTPAGQIADTEISAQYEDLDQVAAFANSVDVVTFEFENVPAKTIEEAAKHIAVHPKGEILYITQNRLREKSFLFGSGFPIAPFYKITTVDDLEKAVEKTGKPCVLKTAGFGYDGKGQSIIRSEQDIPAAFAKLSGECVLEAFVDFEKEVSVVCARDERGKFVHYGVIENDHANHVLDVSTAPADVPHSVWEGAVEITRGIAEKLDYVGTMCVEFFLTKKEDLLVNEIAPRPHNSGHLTFGAGCVTSQFEQQLRAVCGLPLGSTRLLKPTAMANLLGDLWAGGEPAWADVLKHENVKLHLYGKKEARKGRKMGHLTASGETAEEAVGSVLNARNSLTGMKEEKGIGKR